MSEELKPCPFCGGKAALRMSWMADGHRYRSVECVECGATTPGNYSEVGDQSVWDWNTRTPEQAIAATLGRGECEMNVLDTGNEAAYEHYEYIMHCANCHHEFGYVQYNEDGGTWMNEKPRFCPNCGRKVER